MTKIDQLLAELGYTAMPGRAVSVDVRELYGEIDPTQLIINSESVPYYCVTVV